MWGSKTEHELLGYTLACFESQFCISMGIDDGVERGRECEAANLASLGLTLTVCLVFIYHEHNLDGSDVHCLRRSGLSLRLRMFNWQDPHNLVSGLHNGQVAFFDTRRGGDPVELSSLANSHRDPTHQVLWINSKSGTEFFSSSSDGQVSNTFIHSRTPHTRPSQAVVRTQKSMMVRGAK